MTGLSAWRGLLFASLFLGAPAGAAERGALTPACAERDLGAVTLIERHGEAGDTPAAALVEAGLMLLQARLSCLAGDEAGALAMYDRVLQVKIVVSYPKN